MARLLNAATAAFAVVLLAACGGDSDSPADPGNGGPKPVTSLSVTPTTASLVIGRTTQLTATAKDAAGSVLAGRTVTWTTSAPTIATVDANGLVTGVAAGAANITATSEGKSAQAAITVTAIPVASVTVAPNAPPLKVGANVTLTATTKDEQGNVLDGRAVTWSTSAANVATIDAATGVVTGVAVGTATMTATSEGKTGSTTVTVSSDAKPVNAILIAPALDTLEAYDVVQINAILRDADGNVLTGRQVTWTSSNTAVATIDAQGKLTGIDRGTVTVTATSEGKTATVTRVVVIKYRSITAGTMHACDIASGGIVWCWGLNGNEGRIGSSVLGAEMKSTVPVKLPGDIRFSQISTYGRHTCGITAAGKAYCWGNNGWGTLGDGSNVAMSFTPVAVGGGITFRSISAGADHTCGVSTDNRAFCWGNNEWRQLGKGTVFTSMPTLVSETLAFAKITAGTGFTCGITTGAGDTYCWGANQLGQVGDGGKISYGNVFVAAPQKVVGNQKFQSVSLGNQYTCAVAVGGQGYCWGSNNTKLGSGNQTGDTSTPAPMIGGHVFQQISSGYGHSCGVTSLDAVYCWGANGSGQLGSPTLNGTGTPTRAGNVVAIEVAASGIGTGSGSHSCAISKDRLTTYCWGRNDVGQLGTNTTSAGPTANPNPAIVTGQKPL